MSKQPEQILENQLVAQLQNLGYALVQLKDETALIANLRSKRELIEKFILENLSEIEDEDNIPQEFDKFWNEERQKAFKQLVKDENLSEEKTQKLIENYLFAEREPLRDEILELIEGEKPSVLQRKNLGDRILKKILGFVDTFINGITGN
ncbi:MAG: hypothetical protein K8S16_18790 [Bacteroidales bacterium]|nr:hypothetical protein [Bacteroidales bacterium]